MKAQLPRVDEQPVNHDRLTPRGIRLGRLAARGDFPRHREDCEPEEAADDGRDKR